MANGGGNSVTELTASTPALVRVISGSAYSFNDPDAMAVAGNDLFVANEWGNSLTVLDAATGGLVRVMSGSRQRVQRPRCHGRRGEGPIRG